MSYLIKASQFLAVHSFTIVRLLELLVWLC